MSDKTVRSWDLNGNAYDVSVKDLSWRPSAYGIVINKGKILLVSESGRFHLPGGGVNLGEDPAQAVIREIKEETGVFVADPVLLAAKSGFFTWESINQTKTLNHVQSLLLYYPCKYVSSDTSRIKLDEYEKASGLTAEWVDVETLGDIVVGTTIDWRPIVHSYIG